jgi:tRNA (guanine-N7-)-methyltransferase
VSAGSALWPAVFGNTHPVEIEIGPGRGEVLLAFAAARPGINFFAIEHGRGMAEALARDAAARGLANVRVVGGDARCIMSRLVPAGSVAAVHVYFPDPWPKTRHRHRRLFDTPELASAIARVLLPGGLVHLASDLGWLAGRMRARLAAAGLLEVGRNAPPRPVSKFERKYAAAGTHAATFAKPAAATREAGA